ncbi:MAG: esterase [Bacteroidia bacterium]
MSELHVREAGQGEPAVLLHGLFGNGANLGALARSLQTDYHVISPDLPGHGRSPVPDAFDLPGMAEAVFAWLQSQVKGQVEGLVEGQGLERVHLVGHSLGGKVAMQMALSCPERVASLVVADIAPVAYPPSHEAVFAGLQAVAAADCATRQAAQAVLAQHVRDAQVVQFLLSSLRREGGGEGEGEVRYGWRFDHAAIQSAYPQLLAAPAGELVYAGPVLFIKGGDSHYIDEAQRSVIEQRFPAASLRVMADCGHWLHAEKPELFNSTVRRFLSRHVISGHAI